MQLLLISSSHLQTVMDCVVAPPKQGDPSFELWHKEKESVLQSLNERAKMVADTFNSIPGMSCNTVQGAMYAFPQVKFSPSLTCLTDSFRVASD